MAKPWAKYEIDYLDHPKFRALNANAIVLWLEAKNHCDKFQTDGRFPALTVRTFRYFSVKAVELLSRSCGVKPNGEQYAPLWESQEIGGVRYLTMHDYLEHNDCRDRVLDRIAKAEAEREADRARKATARAAKAAKAEAEAVRVREMSGRTSTGLPAPVRQMSGSITETETETESLSGKEHQRETYASPSRDPFNDAGTTERAGRFLDRYQELYPKHRKGARYALKPHRDYAAAVTLCTTWPDDRLDKLAVIFLTTDHKFAEEGSRTVPQFLALASWCDGKLAEYESTKGAA